MMVGIFASSLEFASCPISQLDSQAAKWKVNLRNGTCVPGGDFVGCENFRKLNSGLANLSFEDFASWNFNLRNFGPHFRKLKYCSVF